MNDNDDQRPLNRKEIGALHEGFGKSYDDWLRRKGMKATAWKGRTYARRRYHPLRGSPVKKAIRALKGGEA